MSDSKKHIWLIRPSQMGRLMSKGRAKADKWGETALKYIQESVLFHKYGIEPKEIRSPQLEKGIVNEKQNIKLASDVLGWFDVDENAPKYRIANDYIIGEPDVNTSILADIKSSFDASTFPFFLDEVKNKDYILQLNCYMWLTGKTTSQLVYVLSNHPQNIIENEIKRLTYFFANKSEVLEQADGINDVWQLAEEKATEIVLKESNFDQIPKAKKVKRFIVDRDDELIEEMRSRIVEAREIFDDLYSKI